MIVDKQVLFYFSSIDLKQLYHDILHEKGLVVIAVSNVVEFLLQLRFNSSIYFVLIDSSVGDECLELVSQVIKKNDISTQIQFVILNTNDSELISEMISLNNNFTVLDVHNLTPDVFLSYFV